MFRAVSPRPSPRFSRSGRPRRRDWGREPEAEQADGRGDRPGLGRAGRRLRQPARPRPADRGQRAPRPPRPGRGHQCSPASGSCPLTRTRGEVGPRGGRGRGAQPPARHVDPGRHAAGRRRRGVPGRQQAPLGRRERAAPGQRASRGRGRHDACPIRRRGPPRVGARAPRDATPPWSGSAPALRPHPGDRARRRGHHSSSSFARVGRLAPEQATAPPFGRVIGRTRGTGDSSQLGRAANTTQFTEPESRSAAQALGPSRRAGPIRAGILRTDAPAVFQATIASRIPQDPRQAVGMPCGPRE